MVGDDGFEPPTPAPQTQYSIQTELLPDDNGADDGNRTRCLYFDRVACCHHTPSAIAFDGTVFLWGNTHWRLHAVFLHDTVKALDDVALGNVRQLIERGSD